MTDGIDPATLDRFRADMAALGCSPQQVLLVAVSGGADSLALLLLTHALAGERCRAATVDHGLRAEARGEAEWVAALCAQRGVPHAILSAPLPARVAGSANLSGRARALRHTLLIEEADRVGASAILMAHHADDQAETLMMRLNRGSGVGGLSGVRAVNGRVVRPLLGWRRAELAAIVAAAGLTAVDDPTNGDMRFDRARMRRHLADAPWLDIGAVAQSAAWLAEADAALEWSMARLIDERWQEDASGVQLNAADLPDELARRLILRALLAIEPEAMPRGEQVTRIVAALRRGETSTLGGVLCATRGGRWTFCLAPPRRSL